MHYTYTRYIHTGSHKFITDPHMAHSDIDASANAVTYSYGFLVFFEVKGTARQVAKSIALHIS